MRVMRGEAAPRLPWYDSNVTVSLSRYLREVQVLMSDEKQQQSNDNLDREEVDAC